MSEDPKPDKPEESDWKDGPYGPAAQDRMDRYEHDVMTGKVVVPKKAPEA